MKDLVVLSTFLNHSEAEMAKTLLESNDIPSIIQADDVAGLGFGQTFVKGVKLLVNETDISRAKEILNIS
ncbi:MAG: DUF2007 domain-containing protein [Candidatus Delongbacteria bacterium]|jgi:hypothetical protein|nr:DUF2007 domain-containing protein [Candidatus Delongbacteria bacterium]